jgi:hypothetical protein
MSSELDSPGSLTGCLENSVCEFFSLDALGVWDTISDSNVSRKRYGWGGELGHSVAVHSTIGAESCLPDPDVSTRLRDNHPVPSELRTPSDRCLSYVVH